MKYLYSGPASGATIKGKEYLFFPNKEIELPEAKYVKTLVALGHLTEIKEKVLEPVAKKKVKKGR